MILDLTTDNLLTIISLIFAMIGGSFIFLQWRKKDKNTRAEFIFQILEKLRLNKPLWTLSP